MSEQKLFDGQPDKSLGEELPIKQGGKTQEPLILGSTGEMVNNREVLPKERLFDIVVTETGPNAVSVALKHKTTNKVIDLTDYLPAGCNFEKAENFRYEMVGKKVCFPEERLQYRGSLISLFHEIGHSQDKQGLEITKLDNIKAFAGGIYKLIKSIRIEKDQEKSAQIEKNVYRIKCLPAEALMSEEYLDKRIPSDARQERDAWSFSIQSLIKLKKQGFDVFAEFENMDQVLLYIERCLNSYNIDAAIRRLLSSNVKDVKDAEGLACLMENAFVRDFTMPAIKDDLDRTREEMLKNN